ncbi:hypothetical protein NE237_024817 [Protea cynaroides]|uniref:Uncharacterized protein n=1 Tax=Protea cynaroides TaxID=273540 RepID=A0A9Q0JZJ9_9MAGN|nr:hypothetical protein NE237_024817 [Protea cynaroides]
MVNGTCFRLLDDSIKQLQETSTANNQRLDSLQTTFGEQQQSFSEILWLLDAMDAKIDRFLGPRPPTLCNFRLPLYSQHISLPQLQLLQRNHHNQKPSLPPSIAVSVPTPFVNPTNTVAVSNPPQLSVNPPTNVTVSSKNSGISVKVTTTVINEGNKELKPGSSIFLVSDHGIFSESIDQMIASINAFNKQPCSEIKVLHCNHKISSDASWIPQLILPRPPPFKALKIIWFFSICFLFWGFPLPRFFFGGRKKEEKGLQGSWFSMPSVVGRIWP